MWRGLKILLIITFLIFLGGGLIMWWSTSVSPSDVRTYSLNELRGVSICRNCQCVGLEPSIWPELIRKVINLRFTIGTGWKGEESQELYEVEFDWGKNGRFGIRLWTRPSLNGHVIATFQRKHEGGTAYYGDYSGDELKKSLDEFAQPEKMLEKLCGIPGGQHNNSLEWTRYRQAFWKFSSRLCALGQRTGMVSYKNSQTPISLY